MKYHLALSVFIALGLTACSASETAQESFSSITFEAVNDIAKGDKMKPSKCSETLSFENIALDQKCWTWTVNDVDEAGEVGLAIGLQQTEVHDGKLGIIASSESGITLREKIDGTCAQYMVIDFGDPAPLIARNFPVDVEIAVAATKSKYCGKLSKEYAVIDG